VKFLTKLGKSAAETYSLLTEVYDDECLSRTQVLFHTKKYYFVRMFIIFDIGEVKFLQQVANVYIKTPLMPQL
jgi:hypothetical protein